jgi:hypothetical protein
VAAACGLPTFFLEPDCYTTRDLACFSEQTFPSEDALREITRVLSDPGAYAVARHAAFRNAREYYTNGSNLELDASFFQRLLHSGTSQILPTTDTSHRSAQEVEALG